MQLDFHYYATYCAAYLAGWPHEECMEIAFSSQFTDCCSRTFLVGIRAPRAAATTQLQTELMDVRTDVHGLQDITRIWASFHFLPYDLQAEPSVKTSRRYRSKYRLICGPNGVLVKDTVELARGAGTVAAGLAMHVLADTWAHRYFAGTPSLVINNTAGFCFYELLSCKDRESSFTERRVKFHSSPSAPDDIVHGVYTATMLQTGENSVMNLGHGRAGHLPDYSFMRYRYLPAWGDYEEIIKDNPSDYYHAFCQMILALRYLRGDRESFDTDQYDWEAAAGYEDKIRAILEYRQTDASADWKAFGEQLSGQEIEVFDQDRYVVEYLEAEEAEKDGTFLGRFILAALAQKSMVTNKIFRSGNLLAGFSVDYAEKGFRGIRDFRKLLNLRTGE